MSIDKIEHIVRELGLPVSFSTEFWDHSENIHVQKNDFLLKKGRVCKYIGIVQQGAFYAYVPGEEDVTTDLFLPRAFITYYRSFLTQRPAHGAIKASVDSVVCAFSYSKYQELTQSKEWLLFFKYVADRLFIRKCARENSLISNTALERYQQLVLLHPGVEQLFPQYRIASYLGIQPETLSRLKSLDLHQGN